MNWVSRMGSPRYGAGPPPRLADNEGLHGKCDGNRWFGGLSYTFLGAARRIRGRGFVHIILAWPATAVRYRVGNWKRSGRNAWDARAEAETRCNLDKPRTRQISRATTAT